ncbi:MAG: phosphate ABC transporter permease PstA [Candidatus Nanopelagicaceae bacterium]
MMTIQVTPQRPWRLSTKEITYPAIMILSSALAAGLMVKTTGFNGKLGFFGLFFLLSTFSLFFYKLRLRGLQAARDSLATSLFLAASLAVFMPVLSILFSSIQRGLPGLHATLFTDTMFSASYFDPIDKGGLFHAIIGTLYLIILTVLISVPTGILTALYLTEIKGPGSRFIQFTVQAMSGVPSVVAGLFIYAALILSTPIKASGIAGAFALSILMIPTVTRTAQEVLLLIPNDLREAGLAMGATQWKTVSTIVIPAARNGLLTATILGVARIAGETAPLIFTIGGSDKLNWNPFVEYQGALPFYVWKGLLLGTPESIQRAWTGILVLLLLVLGLFSLARIFGSRKVG